MDLILWRHADAEDGSPDAERRLTAKGKKQAARVAKWLEARLPKGTRVLSSPARRARQTARALRDDIEVLEALDVGADAKAVLAACGWPAQDSAVVIVGHQPTLGQVAALVLGGRVQDWSLAKGAVIWLEARNRGGAPQAKLRAALSPDLV
jgi:phosphohistidine phosphatase